MRRTTRCALVFLLFVLGALSSCSAPGSSGLQVTVTTKQCVIQDLILGVGRGYHCLVKFVVDASAPHNFTWTASIDPKSLQDAVQTSETTGSTPPGQIGFFAFDGAASTCFDSATVTITDSEHSTTITETLTANDFVDGVHYQPTTCRG